MRGEVLKTLIATAGLELDQLIIDLLRLFLCIEGLVDTCKPSQITSLTELPE